MNLRKGPECPAPERLKALTDEGSNVSVTSDTKATQYIRSGRELLRSANNYAEDGQLDMALVLYTRYLTIFLEKLRTHPGFKEVPPEDKKLVKDNCCKILPKAESLRASLLKRFEEEHEAYQQALKKSEEAAAIAAQADKKQNQSIGTNSWDSFRYEPTPGATSMAMATTPRPSAPPVSPNDFRPVSNSNNASNKMVSAYSDIMADLGVEQAVPGSGVPVSQVPPGPRFDRNTKPSRFLSPMNSGLRVVVVPGDLITTFLACANRNTEANVETCGFLTGRILQGKLVITDLIIPKQDGTSDSCTAKGDEEYLMVQDRLDLITFGWIHTHPSQTAFLSSVDMHSQYCYQQMMPEAIAIVCAPRKDQVGTFALTPEGMDVIGNCPHTSGFHTHSPTSVPLFFDATHHVFDTSRRVTVHDLRYT